MDSVWLRDALLAEYRETCETVLASMIRPGCREDVDSFVIMEGGNAGGGRFPDFFRHLFGLEVEFLERAQVFDLWRACGLRLDRDQYQTLLVHDDAYRRYYLRLLQAALERAGQDPRQLIAVAIIGYSLYCEEIVRPALQRSGDSALLTAFEDVMRLSDAEMAEEK